MAPLKPLNPGLTFPNLHLKDLASSPTTRFSKYLVGLNLFLDPNTTAIEHVLTFHSFIETSCLFVIFFIVILFIRHLLYRHLLYRHLLYITIE